MILEVRNGRRGLEVGAQEKKFGGSVGGVGGPSDGVKVQQTALAQLIIQGGGGYARRNKTEHCPKREPQAVLGPTGEGNKTVANSKQSKKENQNLVLN